MKASQLVGSSSSNSLTSVLAQANINECEGYMYFRTTDACQLLLHGIQKLKIYVVLEKKLLLFLGSSTV